MIHKQCYIKKRQHNEEIKQTKNFLKKQETNRASNMIRKDFKIMIMASVSKISNYSYKFTIFILIA